MDVFLAIAVIVTLALLATGPSRYRFRKSGPITRIVSGGWPAVVVGFAIGPSGFALISDRTIEWTAPLLILALGWVGLMIGLQLRVALLRQLPASVSRILGYDLATVLVLFGTCAGLLLWAWAGRESGIAAIVAPWTLLVGAALGWSMETRSLGASPGEEARLLLIRLGGGLASLIAVVIVGVGDKLTTRSETGAIQFDGAYSTLALASAIGVAGILGVLARYVIGRTGRSQGEQLAVYIGLIAFVGGISAELGNSPLLSAALAGIVIANIAADEITRFERFILKAEHVVAIIVFLMAGMLMSRTVGWWGIGIAAAFVVLRGIAKPPALRFAEAGAPDAGHDRSLRWTLLRQSPIALALALGLALVEPSAFNRELVTIVVIIGLSTEFAALFLARSPTPRAGENGAAS